MKDQDWIVHSKPSFISSLMWGGYGVTQQTPQNAFFWALPRLPHLSPQRCGHAILAASGIPAVEWIAFFRCFQPCHLPPHVISTPGRNQVVGNGPRGQLLEERGWVFYQSARQRWPHSRNNPTHCNWFHVFRGELSVLVLVRMRRFMKYCVDICPYMQWHPLFLEQREKLLRRNDTFFWNYLTVFGTFRHNSQTSPIGRNAKSMYQILCQFFPIKVCQRVSRMLWKISKHLFSGVSLKNNF